MKSTVRKFNGTALALTGAMVLALAACSGTGSKSASSSSSSSSSSTSSSGAMAEMKSASGSRVSGQVRITPTGSKGAQVSVQLQGLEPNSKHGFHVHEKGDCSAADFSSAGGHFNPAGGTHGAPGSMQHHAGDLGNITADASGSVRTTIDAPQLTIGSGATDVVGKAIIVHAKPDDLKTQPTGDAGGRLACGVVMAQGR